MRQAQLGFALLSGLYGALASWMFTQAQAVVGTVFLVTSLFGFLALLSMILSDRTQTG